MAASRLPAPAAENGFLAGHVARLCAGYRHWTGRDLVAPQADPAVTARVVLEAPFALLSHGGGADPVFDYGNRLALRLFEASWEELTCLPSRLSAEPDARAERARLLAQVARWGYIEDYTGVRISRRGRRFRIARATVWNLLDDSGRPCGQAAMFRDWQPLEP
jgi:hypothetical protein